MNEARLPEKCYGILPSTGELIEIHRGVDGYYPVKFNHLTSPKEAADLLNRTIKVSPIQAEAMLNGSMFGWDVPGADPDYLERQAENHPAS